MSDFNSLVQYTVENISRPIKYIIYKLTEFIRVVDKFIFRQVPAGAASGYANIEKVEGNTVAWNQLLKSGKLVDMGLPSGLLWATCNIDITQEDGFAASPFQYECSFFSWGNIEGHNPISNNAFDYNWGSVNAQQPWYEGQPYGSTPGSTLAADIVAGDTYDSARYNLGSLFKMPTSAQFKELFDNCDFVQADGTTVIASSVTDKRVTVNGCVGIYLKSKINGNLMFFSASGIGNGSSLNYRGSNGGYWSASFNSARNARRLYFNSGGVYPQSLDNRYYGFAVRAVVNPNTIDTGHNNHKYYVTKDINHDLTTIFGAGNEPTTVAEFEAWMAQNGLPSVADYNAGELISCKMNGMQTEDSSQQTLDTIALDVTTITGINTSTNVREVIFPNGMKQADRAGTVKDVLDLLSDTATVNVGSRAYQSVDVENPSMVTDGANITNYALYPNEVERNLPFYIEDISGLNNTISIVKNSSSVPTITVEYSFDNVMWQTLGTTDTTALTIDIPANGRCYIRANANAWGDQSGSTYINTSNNSLVGGNISSILYGENFRNSANIPFTSSNNRCYQSLFVGNTNLIYSDKLFFDNKTSTFMCFGMFSGCTALKTAPLVLPTDLTAFCFHSMFSGCSSLQSTPFLMAKTLSQSCYYHMFENCSSLNKVIIGADDISASTCITSWLGGVGATGIFYNLGIATYPSGASGIPSGWTTETTAPYQSQILTYTDLQDANGNPLNPRYKVEQGGTEQVLPVNTSTPTTVAPTLTTTYTKDNN